MEVRQLGEDWVVDLGTRWYRCRCNGEVITKTAEAGKVTARPATPEEREYAINAVRASITTANHREGET
jgi:glutathione synthase/RimK-type ligase-like ATP-grasp enzyme